MTRTATPRAAFFLLFLGFFLVFQILFRSQPFSDPGALWHIRVGDWIFDHGGFPHTDPFTWSYTGQFWIPQQWSGECLMSLAHRFGGFDAMLTLMNVLLAFTAAWLGKRFIDGGLHPLPASAIVGLGMVVIGFHVYMRPHLATIVLMAVVMAWLVDFERRRIGINRLYWLIPLCVLWTNIHGGVLGGIVTVGLAAVGWFLFRDRSVRETVILLVIVVGCLASTLLNPFFLDMHRTWIRIVGSSAMKEFVPEHFPLSLARTDGQAVVGFGCFYLLMLAGTWPKRPRVMWLIPLVWFGLSFTGIRHGPLFVAIGLVAMADFLPETIWFRLLKKYGDTFVMEATPTPRAAGWRALAGVGLVIALALGLQRGRIVVPVVGYAWVRFDNKLVPVELIEPLQEYAKTRPDGYPIFNDANVGGFLIYFTPNLKIFMDDRFELYGDRGLRDYVEMVNDHPERIEEWAKKAPFDRAVVDCDTALDEYLKKSDKWREVARDRKAALYERVQ